MRTLGILLTILAASVCAGCTALALAAKRAEIRRIEEDWGVHKPRRDIGTPTCLEGNPPLTHTLP